MIELDGLKIYANRGDTGSFTVTFTGQDVPPDGTIARIGLRKTLDSEDVLWVKDIEVSSGRVSVPLFQADTDLPRGKYYWVLRLGYANGDVYTPMQPAEFHIWPDGVPFPWQTGGGGNG